MSSLMEKFIRGILIGQCVRVVGIEDRQTK